jgi:hypothetical protein
MGWYISDGSMVCASCQKLIEEGTKIYFLDGDKAEHFICFWNRHEKNQEVK